ncbi:dihydrolipoamide acetyltransferase [Mycoplasmopsis anatis]|uniref:Dihydrolipoamide acetyltransferase n=1 Tax=Mycoplasmopsis anatis TaxID=171279 RepID=A0A9Q3L8D1_9BACT|nr:2-oxo acid dehydrogenase subunit E2 [Mycoplasmopsis anatis]MBW0594888.1 dihydrolipoamide acetyltransferase [Mycoplasmopsis anatis]MBW0595672.1 dihydrolipoamide acetyltransferase [Mycoplasmopsis anatis]MBW0595967.1 dihydrolipoamide acetyltransferase [Mycoplasmopsis anatis]MBW0596686.1 dihydrolipoamide acetyltransferase [Mycoplasmopsis anatis]MBW0597381.1 dihydrolipoamide acetyltransferase [Mycoplasmopsis anatis]
MTVKSTPIARALAAKMGIKIEDVKGTGIGGRILVEDIKNFKATPVVAPSQASTTQAAPIAPIKPTFEAHSEPVSPMRKAIAKAMTNSWENVAYTNLVHKVDMTRLWDLRASIKDLVFEKENIKLTFLPYIVKAVAIALKEFPKFAAKYNEKESTLEYPGSVNVGIAVDTEAGLMVPVINDANRLSILEVASEISRLASAARKRTIKPQEMKGAGFTITNYGSVGSLFGVPVINYPELAICGVGAIIDEPVIQNGQIVPGKVMYITVAADHRWIDGAEVGRFASRIKELLEKPEVLGVY